MARRIWVIAEKDEVEQSDIDAANAHNYPEIANGIPPALEGIIDEAGLPMAYEEIELIPSPMPPSRDALAEIDELKVRVEKLEKK